MDFEKVNRIAKVHHYKQKGFSNAKISRMLGIHRNTVASDLKKEPKEAVAWVESLTTRSRKLAPYKGTILNWLNDEPELSAAQIEDWLDEQFDYTEAASSTIRSYVKELRETYGIPKVLTYRHYEAVPELPAGKQIQVDFGEITVKRALTDSRIKLYCIGFVLSHSRFKYVEWQEKPFTTEDVIRAHENAFGYFGGRTEEIVYDQDKLMIVSENHGDILFTKQFQSYVLERQFIVHVCRAADPESKGKIEAVIKFVKYNFARGRRFHSIESWQDQCESWLDRRGNFKTHEKTKKRPIDVFTLEKSHLISISNKSIPSNNESITKTVLKDNTIQFKSNYYSVPIGTYHPRKPIKVRVVTSNNQLSVFELKSGERIAEHPLAKGKGKLTKNPDHGREADKKLKLNQHINEVLSHFQDKEKATVFIERLKVNYPRHMRDQLRVIESVIDKNSAVLDTALNECMALNLFSAVELRDVAKEIARRHAQTDSQFIERDELPEKYQTITAVERSVESYLQVLGGERS